MLRNPQCSQTLQFYKNLRQKWFLSDFLNCLAQVEDQTIRTFTFITDVLVAFTADSTGLCITIIKSYATTRASFPQVAVPMFTQRGATCVRHSMSLRRSQSRCSKPKHNSRSCQGRSEEEVGEGQGTQGAFHLPRERPVRCFVPQEDVRRLESPKASREEFSWRKCLECRPRQHGD